MRKIEEEEDEVERCRRVRAEVQREFGSIENIFKAMRERSRERAKRGSATRVKKTGKSKAAQRTRIKTH